jgi:hypothetical protein
LSRVERNCNLCPFGMRTDATSAIQSATTNNRLITNKTAFDSEMELLFPAAVFLTAGAEGPEGAPERPVAAPMTAGDLSPMEVDGVRLAAGGGWLPVTTPGTVVTAGRPGRVVAAGRPDWPTGTVPAGQGTNWACGLRQRSWLADAERGPTITPATVTRIAVATRRRTPVTPIPGLPIPPCC